MASYKQWSEATRDRRFRDYKLARSAGTIKPPGPCEMCGQTKGTMHHAEDYGPTTEDYFAALHSLCARCHAMLHLRFKFPGRWARYKFDCHLHGVQPPVPHLASIFGQANGWTDIPIAAWPGGNSWWEKLSTDRYEGDLL